MISETDELKSLVPLYVNGRLPDNRRKDFEEALAQDSGLAREVREYRAIRGAYSALECEIPAPSPDLYGKIRSRIRQEPRRAVIQPKEKALTGIFEFFQNVFGWPRLAWAVAGVQLAVVLTLLAVYPKTEKYETLSGGALPGENGLRINIIFQSDSREKDIRELLGRVGARIVNGPSAEGLYTIAVKDKSDPESIVGRLKEDQAVRFAERAY